MLGFWLSWGSMASAFSGENRPGGTLASWVSSQSLPRDQGWSWVGWVLGLQALPVLGLRLGLVTVGPCPCVDLALAGLCPSWLSA